MRWRDADGVRTQWSYGTHAQSDRWIQVQNGASTDRIDFDPAGRPTQSRTTRGGTTYTLESSFDERNLRTAVRLISPWISSVGYRYNARMQLDTLIDRMGGKTVLAYNDDGQEIGRTLPNGLDIVRDYPSTHIPAYVSYSNFALDQSIGVGYSHNEKGLVGARTQRYDHGLQTGDLVRTYAYDKLARLTGYSDTQHADGSGNCSGTEVMDPDGGVCVPAGGTYVGGQSYAYDVVGNPQGTNVVVENGNRLTQFNGYTLQYDEDGNLIRKYKPNVLDQYFTWNSLGQLVQTTTNGLTVSYAYDGFGRWTQYTDPTGTIQYIWDGDDLFLEQNAAGAATEYTYYLGVDQPHSIKRGSSIHYYATDFPGNVVGLIGSQQELANEYAYTPFGEREYAREDVPNALQFQARHYDPASKLYAWRARWYDPQLRRFISEDPIGLEGGINPYAFAENNPVNFTDPYGLQAEGGNCDNPYTVQVELCEITAVGRPRTGGGGARAPLSCRGPCSTPSGPGSTPGVPTGSVPTGGFQRPTESVERERLGKMCLTQGALAIANVALDVSGTRLLIGAGVAGARIAMAGRGVGSLGFDVFVGKAGAAFRPGFTSTGVNVGGFAGVGLMSGHVDGRDLAKLVGGFVPIIGSGIAINDAIVACRAL